MEETQDTGSTAVVDQTATATEQPDTSTQPDQTTQATDITAKETTDAGKKAIKVPDALKPKVKDEDRFRGRISDLVNSRKQTEDENRRLRDEIASLRNGNAGKPKETKKGDGPPQEADYDDYKEYLVDAAKWEMKQEQAAKAKQDEEQGQRDYITQKRGEFEQHAAAIVEQVPQFWDAITDPSLPVTEVMHDAILDLGEMGPFTMLWLATHRQEALNIAKMKSPHAAWMAIGRLASKLEAEIRSGDGQADAGTQTTQPVNQFTPKPVPKIGGGPPGNLDGNPTDKDDIKTWLAKEAARMKKKNPNALVYGA